MPEPRDIDVPKLTPEQLDAEAKRLLHRNWGSCKDSPEYAKADWNRFSLILDRLQRRSLKAKDGDG